MAEFYVKINELQSLVPALESISKQLENEKDYLESVRNGLCLGSGTHDIKSRIDGLIDELETESDIVYQMKEALEDIIRSYLFTEAIVAKDIGQILKVVKEKGVDYLQDVWQNIGEFLEDWSSSISRKNDNVLNCIDDDCTRNGFPDDYKNVLYQLYDDVPPEYIAARDLYDKYVEEMIVANFNSVDSNGDSAPYHLDGKLYLNTVADLNNPRGDGTTYYHEYGHYIVFKEGWIVDRETQGDFAKFEETLKEEVSAYINSFEEKYQAEGEALGLSGDVLSTYVKNKTTVEIKKDINGASGEYEDINNGMSDIIDGVSNNKYQPSYGHGWESDGVTSYWDYDPTRVANEAFAQIYSAQMTGDVTELEKMMEIMPKTYAVYMEMIENAR